MFSIAVFAYALLHYPVSSLAASTTVSPTSLASQYSLTTSTSLPFPTATLSNSDAQSFLVSGWSLSKGKIENGADDIAFVDDPFPNAPAPGSTDTPTGPVLQVTYPAGSFQSTSGGLQLYSLWNTSDGSQFNSMLLSYEVAFDADFNFVKGGKLPGLRGGPQPTGCDGGQAANGTNCFSSRLMWRTSGQGEVYAYIPDSNRLCSGDPSEFLCNSDGFGTSIDRGSFSFTTGAWNHVTLLVRLNNVGSDNGEVSLFFNDVNALDHTNINYRTDTDINIGGLYLSTFFGGDDSSWATPNTVNTYFRNFQLWGSSATSNATGTNSTTNSARSTANRATLIVLAASAVLGMLLNLQI